MGAADADAAREEAREILGQRDYRPTEFPRPFRGVLEWLGDRLAPVRDFANDVIDWVDRLPWPFRLALLGLVIAGVVLTILAIARLRTDPARRPARVTSVDDAPQDPDELERLADEAEAEGDFDFALRLRFRAGLLRLDRAGLVEFRPSITSGEVSRALHREPFDRLARRHDEVVYGGVGAGPADLDEARSAWPELVRAR